MSTLLSAEEIQARPRPPAEIEMPAADSLAARSGVWIHAGVRRTAHQRRGQYPRCRTGCSGFHRLVPGSVPARA
jgi:hypothetical protein